MVRRTILLLSLVALLAATVAEAQPQRPGRPPVTREGRWDFSLQTRYTASQEFTYDNGSSLSLSDDLGWGFGFGYHITNNFNLGMAFGWRSIPYQAIAIDATNPDDTESYGNKFSISSLGITADWYILTGPITPYVTGSAAWVLIDTNIFAGYSGSCYYDPLWGYICGNYPTTFGTDTGAYNLGLGGRFQMNESFFIRAGYEYSWIGAGPIDGANIMRIDIGFMN